MFSVKAMFSIMYLLLLQHYSYVPCIVYIKDLYIIIIIKHKEKRKGLYINIIIKHEEKKTENFFSCTS